MLKGSLYKPLRVIEIVPRFLLEEIEVSVKCQIRNRKEEGNSDFFLFSFDYFLPTKKSAYSTCPLVLQITLNDALIL